MTEPVRRSCEIVNRLGLHARPAMALVDLANTFTGCTIRVHRSDNPAEQVDAKSIMQLMMLAATKGTVLEIEASGQDAESACDALAALVAGGFDEN